jgi:hypothetical protein
LIRSRGYLLQNFAEWDTAAWNKITGKTVEQLFKKCCITNALGGTENVLRKNSDLGHQIEKVTYKNV